MKIEEAAAVADEFLTRYVMDHNFFTPESEIHDDEDSTLLRVFFYRAMVHADEPEIIRLSFFHGRKYRNAQDPELRARIQECLDALAAAHPEVMEHQQVLAVARSH